MLDSTRTAGPETSAKYNQPPIEAIDLETGKKVKLKLQLRHMSFSREIAALPSDLLQLHKILMKHRSNRNVDLYMIVSVWNKMRVYERFWESFKFSSEAEFFAYYDLPDGATLGRWTVLVELFDKTTFVLLGETVLLFMTELITKYQEDTDIRKKDYDAIFENYCKDHDSFDRTSFYRVVRHYVEEKYAKLFQQKAPENASDNKTIAKDAQKVGTRWVRKIKPVSSTQAYGPRLSKDFAWQEQKCSTCVSHVQRQEDMLKHIRKLESLIERRLGAKAVPERPVSLKDL